MTVDSWVALCSKAGGAQAPQQDSRASCRPDEHGGDDRGGASGAPVLRSGRAAAAPPALPLVAPLRGGSGELRGSPTKGDAPHPVPGQRDVRPAGGPSAERGAGGEASASGGASESPGSRDLWRGSGAAAGAEAEDEGEPVLRRGRRLLSMLSGSGRLSGRLPSAGGAGEPASAPLLYSGDSGSRGGSAGVPGARGEAAAPPFISLGVAERKPGCTCGPPRPGAPPPEGLQGGPRGAPPAPARAARPDLRRLSGGKAKLGAAGGFWLAFPDAALERQFTRYLAAQQLQARPLPRPGLDPRAAPARMAPACMCPQQAAVCTGRCEAWACSACGSCAAGTSLHVPQQAAAALMGMPGRFMWVQKLVPDATVPVHASFMRVRPASQHHACCRADRRLCAGDPAAGARRAAAQPGAQPRHDPLAVRVCL